MARGRALRGADPACAARPDPARRHRAVVPLAHLRTDRRRACRGDRRAADGHARRTARGRATYPPRERHRPRLGPGAGRAAGASAVLVRRANRDRRRAARRVPAGRPPVGESVGRGPPLHRGRAEPQSGARARPQARGPRRRRRRRVRARDGGGRLRAPGQRRGPERPGRAGIRRAARAGGRIGGRRRDRHRCRRASRSRETCSVSSASAATTARTSPDGSSARQGYRSAAGHTSR